MSLTALLMRLSVAADLVVLRKLVKFNKKFNHLCDEHNDERRDKSDNVRW